MMLTIYGLPMATKYQDLKALVKRQCNITDFILDGLVGEGDGTKKVRIGVTDDREGAFVMKSLNGYRYSGNVLQVAPIGKAAPTNVPQQNFDQRGGFAPRNDFPTQGSNYNSPVDHSRPGPWGQGSQWGSNQTPMNQANIAPSSYNYQQSSVPMNQSYQQAPVQRPEVTPYDRQGYAQDRQTYPPVRATVDQQYSQSYQGNVPVNNPMAQRADRGGRPHVLRSVEMLDEPVQPADPPYQRAQVGQSKNGGSGASYSGVGAGGGAGYTAQPQSHPQPWAHDSNKQYDRSYPEPESRSGIMKSTAPSYNRGGPSFSRDDPIKPSPRFSPNRDVTKTGHTPRFSPRRDIPSHMEGHISRFDSRDVKDDRIDRGAPKEGHVPRFSPRRDVHRFSPRRDIPKDGGRFSPRRDVPKDGHRFSPRREVPKDGPRFSPRRDIPKDTPRFSPRRDIPKDSGPRFSPRRDVGKMGSRFSPRRDGPKEVAVPRFSPRDELKDSRGSRLSPRREKVGMTPGAGRVSPRSHDAHKRARYSPSRHDDKSDKYMPEEPTRTLKDIRPAYEPSPQAPSQAMYSGGYRPSVHENLAYPASGMRPTDRSSSWQQEKNFPVQKEESRRDATRMPKFEPREVVETKRSHSPVRKSRSPIRRDRSPIRDRFKKHSPSPRSPRRSWALEKRRSPEMRDAPPPPMWPGDNREDDFKRALPDREEGKPNRIPVWELPYEDSADRHRRGEEDRRIPDQIRVRMDLHRPNQPSPVKRDSPKFEPRESRFDTRDPKFETRDPKFESRDPKFEPRDPKFEPRGPKFEPRDSKFESRGPKFEARDPKFEPRDPKFEPRDPKFEPREPKFESRNTKFEPRDTNFDQRLPKFQSREPEFERRHPQFEPRETKFEPRESKFEPRPLKHHEPKFEPREPKFEPREPKFESRETKFEHHEPKFEHREQKFESREPKFETRGPRFEPREDLAEHRGDYQRDDRPSSREFRDVSRSERGDHRLELDRRDRHEERKGIQINEKFDKELDDIYKRAKEFNKRAQELRKREELAEQRIRRDSKERTRERDDMDLERLDSRRHDDSRSRRDEYKSSDLDWKLDDSRSHTMSPSVKAKRDKAVEELAKRILDKHGEHYPKDLKIRVNEELKISLVKMMKEMYGNQDVSFIEMVVKFNAKYSAKDEQRILEDVIASLPSQYRSMKRAAEDAAKSAPIAKTARLSDPAVMNMDVVQNLAQAQIAEWNMNMQAAMMGFSQQFDILPQMPPQLVIPNPIVDPLMVQHPFASPIKEAAKVANEDPVFQPSFHKEQPVFQPSFQPQQQQFQPQQQQFQPMEPDYDKGKDEGHNLYLCKDDFEPFSDNQAAHLKKFLVSQLIKASESGLGWTPDFTVKGLQSQFRYELLTRDEDTKNWIVNLDFSEFPLFNVLVYTKEELWYERAAIWLPGHSRYNKIEPLTKLKLQNRKLRGVNIEKWKLVKKIVNVKGTRVYVDMPPSSARALEKHKMMLSYELQKVNVFLKAVAVDKDAFDSGLKEMSIRDPAEIITAAQNSPMPSLNHDPNIVKIALKGNKALTVVQARKVKEMVIYHIFKYLENKGHSRTDFLKFGYLLPGYFGILPENDESRRWLMTLDIGKINRHAIVVLGADEGKTKYIRMTLCLNDNCMRGVNNMALAFERVKQSNQGVKGLNFHLWKAIRLRGERRYAKLEIDMDIESVETIIKLKYQLDFVDHRQRQETIHVKYEDSNTNLEDKITRYKAEQVDSYDVANMDLASSDDDDDVVYMGEA